MDSIAIKNINTDYKQHIEKEGAEVNVEPVSRIYTTFKYMVEYTITLAAVILLLPLFAIVAVLIKFDSEGDVFFRQERHGFKGEKFMIYKFRTMVKDAHKLQEQYSHLNEMNGGKLFKSDNDPRITKVGRFLRKTSIDELPQLFNILRGEMTIIGPRPLSTPIEEYSEKQLIRFRVKPGLGCIWQAYFRNETDFESWMLTDALYVENVSLKLDIALLYNISKNVLLGKGAR